jgi:nucleotide sugar dehydrogenase
MKLAFPQLVERKLFYVEGDYQEVRKPFWKERMGMIKGANMKVCVMGLGNIGLSVASYISEYFPTIGFDIKENAIMRAQNCNLKASDRVEYADVYVVVVNTYCKDNAPDMSAIDSCCSKISQTNPNALVCLESTLFVGTARKMALKYGLKYVIVCPHRWWEEDQENHGVKQLRVIGALNKESMKMSKNFYKALKIPLYPLSSLEVAEATKIAENAHRYVQIAFAEELKLIAEKIGLDFEEWRDAVNTKWNVDLPEARTGIGKECLPKDTAFLALLDPNATLLRGAIKANENYVQSLSNKESSNGKTK